MSHWTKIAVMTVGVSAGIGIGVAWIQPATSVPDAQETLVWIARAITPLAQAPREESQTSPDSGDRESAETTPPKNEATDINDSASNTPENDTAPVPVAQPTPSPQFSPITPRPLDAQSSPSPTLEAEIRDIRRQLIQLLTRLETLEQQLQSGNGVVPSPRSSPPASPAPPSATSPTPNPFFNDPPSPQMSLGTQTISLPGDLLFDFNQSAIRPEAASMLEQVAGILESMPFAHVQVAGHTDDVGDPDYNLVLSVKRATSVQEYLRGVLPEEGQQYRWTTTGYGETVPVADNETEEGRQRNRRVDLIISPQ